MTKKCLTLWKEDFMVKSWLRRPLTTRGLTSAHAKNVALKVCRDDVSLIRRRNFNCCFFCGLLPCDEDDQSRWSSDVVCAVFLPTNDDAVMLRHSAYYDVTFCLVARQFGACMCVSITRHGRLVVTNDSSRYKSQCANCQWNRSSVPVQAVRESWRITGIT